MKRRWPAAIRLPPRFRFAAVAVLLASSGGCATYHASPLAAAADLGASASRLTVDPRQLALAPLKSIAIDASDGLDPVEIAVLTVLNSPDLMARRKAAQVIGAQVFAAGLLPDPQISLSQDRPVSGPDHETARSASVGLDLAGLLAATYARRSARATGRQANLDLLWAEWTAAQQARQLAETVLADESRAAILRKVLVLASDRSERSAGALERHDVTLQIHAVDLAAALDARTQITTAEHDAQKARRDLNGLLGLRADVRLPLTPARTSGGYDAAAIARALASLPDRRPDLLALKAGYDAQDANLRKAILAQFPVNSLAAAFAKDPAGTTTQGVAVTLALPLLNGGRGEARIQSATRDQLKAEYQARLDQADAEVRGAVRERAVALDAVAAQSAALPRIEALAGPAAKAFERHDLDSLTYLTLSQMLLTKRADLDDKALTARIAEIALETALFLPPADAKAAP